MSDTQSISASRVRQIISLIDLTNLDAACDSAAVDALCDESTTHEGAVAAICVWPDFVAQARIRLGNSSSIPIASVINFPSGDEPREQVAQTVERTLHEGASELDYVLPYKALLRGELDYVKAELNHIRKLTPDDVLLKVILETGVLKTPEQIRAASVLAINHGADFIKTSTGKVPVNATTEAAGVMLEAIRNASGAVGFKASGGIKTVAEANRYLELAEQHLDASRLNASHIRLGASSLLGDALRSLNG